MKILDGGVKAHTVNTRDPTWLPFPLRLFVILVTYWVINVGLWSETIFDTGRGGDGKIPPHGNFANIHVFFHIERVRCHTDNFVCAIVVMSTLVRLSFIFSFVLVYDFREVWTDLKCWLTTCKKDSVVRACNGRQMVCLPRCLLSIEVAAAVVVVGSFHFIAMLQRGLKRSWLFNNTYLFLFRSVHVCVLLQFTVCWCVRMEVRCFDFYSVYSILPSFLVCRSALADIIIATT